MGMGLCVAFIAFVRLPSLKVSTLLLSGLLIYDVFWVFFSSYIFNANVMLRVKFKVSLVYFQSRHKRFDLIVDVVSGCNQTGRKPSGNGGQATAFGRRHERCPKTIITCEARVPEYEICRTFFNARAGRHRKLIKCLFFTWREFKS